MAELCQDELKMTEGIPKCQPCNHDLSGILHRLLKNYTDGTGLLGTRTGPAEEMPVLAGSVLVLPKPVLGTVAL